MKKTQHLKRYLLLVASVLFIIPTAGFGALNDEITTISSSIQGYLMNNETRIEEEADRLAGSYGSELITFTKSNIRKVDRAGRCVLLRAITKLADKAAVQDVLYSMAMSENGLLHEDVITAISFFDREDVVNIALRLANDTKSRQGANSALTLMKIFGDQSVISSLDQLEESVDDKTYKKEISAARKNIDERLNSSRSAQRDWVRYALPYWRIPREVPLVRSIMIEYFIKAELLNKRGYRFPVAFLKDRLQKNDPLAAALLAVQKETCCIEDMKTHLSDESIMKEVCEFGIAHIEGTRSVDVARFFLSTNSE